MAKRKNRGREVIDILKDAYENGVGLEGKTAVRSYVMGRGHFKSRELYSLGTWERQARYELAREKRIAITNPTSANGYARNPNASPGERMGSRSKLLRDLGTRFDNISLLIEVDSEQVDASPIEIHRAGEVSMLNKILSSVVRELEVV